MNKYETNWILIPLDYFSQIFLMINQIWIKFFMWGHFHKLENDLRYNNKLGVIKLKKI